MIPLCDERAAALSILETELGITNDTRATEELWQVIFYNTESFAIAYPENILNDGNTWQRIKDKIRYAGTIAELMTIYAQHPKLQKHKQFLEYLTARKLKVK